MKEKFVGIKMDEKEHWMLKRAVNGSGKSTSEFIREAITEKIKKNSREIKDIYSAIRKIDNLDPVAVHKKLLDLEAFNHIFYGELVKQNQIIKLIHKRTAKASELTKLIVDDQFVEDEVNKLLDEVELITDAEIQKVNIR